MPGDDRPDGALLVACALVLDSGAVLIARRNKDRSNGGLWEFPGGKPEAGESEEESLRREFLEEFGLDIDVGDFFLESRTRPERGGALVLRSYLARARGAISFLADHDAVAYERPEKLAEYAFSPADRPIAEALAAKGSPILNK
jgi:8-oxo-dGTP diphosphatase